ncbi:MAG: GPW/gp25 family protein [Gemmatimonadaceae bacterium]|jgi:phage baseplate assembly protein W|nr:GPW/gp25 family protein [Gemmatimonadaceae bacterium]
MDAGRILGRGLSFPPRVGADGRMAWSEGEVNVRECVEVVLRTELRERLRLPDFGAGLARYLFESNTTTTRRQIQDRIVKALALWEPRISVESVAVEADPHDPEAAIATIAYRLVATQAQERVSLTVLLAQ